MKTWKIDRIKHTLSDGEWMHEPDKAQWIDEKSGLDCLIVRGPSGALCGYVGVPETHSGFEKDCDNEVFEHIRVHGGLTFSDTCHKGEDALICHTGEVANKNVWWLGFDCAHAGDLCPRHGGYGLVDESYKDFNYVKRETTKLAEQLIGV